VASHSVGWGFFVAVEVHVGHSAVHQMILPPDSIQYAMHRKTEVSCRMVHQGHVESLFIGYQSV
jgi:hypothetical protein